MLGSTTAHRSNNSFKADAFGAALTPTLEARMAGVSSEEILVAAAQAGAFKPSSFDQSIFVRCVEYKLNISSNQAIDLLVASGLVNFTLDPDPSIHIRERHEHWLLSLTEAGAKVLAASNNSFKADSQPLRGRERP